MTHAPFHARRTPRVAPTRFSGRSGLSGLMVLLAAGGCRTLDPVPEGVDANASWLYRNQDLEDEAQIAEALVQLRADLSLDDIDEYLEQLMGPLDAESVAVVGKQAISALPEAEADALSEEDLEARVEDGTLVRLGDQQGMMVATIIPCSIEDTVDVFVRLDQDVIHPDYETYKREYTSDRDAFGLGTPLSWSTDYTVKFTIPTATYEANILGQIRWLEGDDASGETQRYAIARAHLPEPGVFTKGGQYFRQDYQLDLFYPTDDGRTIHLFAVWRDMNLGGFHSSEQAYIAIVSGAFRNGDKEIASFCQEA